ncbi:MAG TPA: ImmA/IrrE family metallo-endopeptidase [Symbiobacteriaceae bacterium]|jgi:Zn-dependent peptidase ImmA (M78 family)|nr:ImmA/IrrE family metallo-endopeptidase [Symbiobacteriaceae bacterium]
MAAPRSHAENEAARVLEQARAEFGALKEPFDPYQVDVELLAAVLFDLGVQKVPDLRVGAREYAGFLDADARLVAVEGEHHEHRQRFSIAHEVGHFVLHYLPRQEHGGIFACTASDMETNALPGSGATAEHLRHVRQELEANLFAGELLMPETSVRAMHKVTGGFVLKMARHFRVSPRAMEIRLERLQLPYTPVLR